MKILRNFAALGALLSLFAVQPAHAVLLSVKSTGMGGTGIAYAQDALAAGYNPATAADLCNRLDVGAYWAHFDGSVHNKGNLNPAVNGKFNPFARFSDYPSVDFGINYNVNCNLSVGFVTYNRNASKTSYRVPLDLIGTSRAGIEYENQTFSPYIAYKWGSHNFGLSVNWQLQRLKVNGFENFVGLSTAPGNVTNKGYNYSNGVGVTLGYEYHFNDCLSFGATYQPITRMERFKKYRGFLAQHGRFDIPQKAGIGMAWRFIPCATLTFDVEYVGWKQIRSLHNPLLPSGGTFPNPLGANNGPGFGWRSVVYYRIGADYAWNDKLTLRAGFRTTNGQFRKTQTALNALVMEPLGRNVVTAGASWTFNCRHEANIFGAYVIDTTMKGKNAIPAAFGGGTTDLQGEIFVLGLSYGYNF